MSRAEFHYEQPSRWSRVLIGVLSLAVIFLSAWILTPIVLANLGSTAATGSDPRPVVARPADTRSTDTRISDTRNSDTRNSDTRMSDPRPTASTPAASESKDLVMAAPPPPPVETAKEPEPVIAAAREEPPAPAFASAGSSGYGLSSAPPQSPAAIANTIPWPAPVAAPVGTQPSTDDAEAAMPPDDFGPVPLPRKRPTASQMAKLGIPLPRPRPDAAGAEAQSTDDPAMDALIERTSRAE